MMPQPHAPEIVYVTNARVSCDGGGGALGHPKVFMQIGEERFAVCKYCDRRFELKADKTGSIPAKTS